MEKRIVRVAAVQIAPVLDRPGGTLEKVSQALDEAAGRGVQFAVFPETFLPYYPYFSYVQPPVSQGKAHLKLYDEAVIVPGPVTEAIGAAAKRHDMVVVMGVTERDGGTLYNAQLIFDADGTMVLKRRKITPTYHERMIWGQGDGAGLKVVDTAVGRVGALACWEHYNPLARYTLMAQGEEIHAAQFPGSMVGQIFGDQMEVTIRHPRARIRLFRRQCHRLAHGRSDRGDHARSRAPKGPARRQLHGDRHAGRPACRSAHDPGRGPADRRLRHGAHHQAQTHDGFGRPLRPARTAATAPRRATRHGCRAAHGLRHAALHLFPSASPGGSSRFGNPRAR